jgi:hypothetical protein
MQVVFGKMAFDDLNIHRLANLPYQLPHPDRYFPMKNGLAVLGAPWILMSWTACDVLRKPIEVFD